MKEELKSGNFGKYKNSQNYHQAFRIKLIDDLVSNQESQSFIERKHGIPALTSLQEALTSLQKAKSPIST